MHETVAGGGCPTASTTLNLHEGALSGFQVVVICSETSHVEGPDTRTMLSIRAEATFGVLGSLNHVYREVPATVVLSDE